MPAKDLAKLVNIIATGLTAEPETRILVSRVVRNHIDAIEALVAEGYTGETIIDQILKLTSSSAPDVTRAALRQSIRRARKDLKRNRSTAALQAAEGRSSAPPKAQSSSGITGDRSSQADPRVDLVELQKTIERRSRMARPEKSDQNDDEL
ncbi:hypothetical protein [Microvirga subterranea]|uniref:hypothetical protein n=1 Tax=Microvirga subterranea TaxID=186651 RepID=UPI0011C07379|nr:hypothetical protein [Microvirga subterranea]